MEEHVKVFKKRILDPKYKPTMLSERTRRMWKRRQEEAVATSQIISGQIYYQSFGGSSGHTQPEELTGVEPGSSYRPEEEAQCEEQILGMAVRWISATNESETSDNSSIDDESYSIDDQDSDQDIIEMIGDDNDEESKLPSNMKTPEKHRSDSLLIDFHDKIMFHQSGLLLSDVIKMATAFSTSIGLTIKARTSLTDMLKICAGEEFQYLQLTSNALKKAFDPPSNVIKHYFYCQNCEKEVIYSSSKESIKII